MLSEWLPGQPQRLIGEMLPLLRRRGLAREDYDPDTLRGHLGLDKPLNRHTARRLVIEADVPAATGSAESSLQTAGSVSA